MARDKDTEIHRPPRSEEPELSEEELRMTRARRILESHQQ